MTTRIFKLKQGASSQNISWAKKMAEYLQSRGFDCSELDDLIYQVAESLSLQLKEELGATTAQKIAIHEYTAAEEVNKYSALDQLIILRSWHKSDEVLRQLLTSALGITLPDEFWS